MPTTTTKAHHQRRPSRLSPPALNPYYVEEVAMTLEEIRRARGGLGVVPAR